MAEERNICALRRQGCGGCPLLETPYPEQLRQKQARVEALLGEFGPVSPILGMEHPWHYRNKANLGKDWGRSHESILHLRKTKQFGLNIDAVRVPYGEHTLKYPVHPQADSSLYSNGKKASSVWVPNPLGAKPKDVFEIPTTCNGMGEKTKHSTQKPEELLRKLVLAASSVGDVVLDPFSGSGTTAVVAEQLQRVWLGCDLSAEYNSWAIDRIDHVIPRTIDQWTAFDRENAKRRESIR